MQAAITAAVVLPEQLIESPIKRVLPERFRRLLTDMVLEIIKIKYLDGYLLIIYFLNPVKI